MINTSYLFAWCLGFCCLVSLFVATSNAEPQIAQHHSLRSTGLLLLTQEQLAQSKISITEQVGYQSALNDIYLMADEALKNDLISVTQNIPHAVSGDPHDYFSVGPYWWPDPTKKDGLPWINKDGQVNPMFRDANSDTRLLQTLLHSVRALSLAYYFSGKQTYADKAIAMLQTWFIDAETKMNPHLDYAQSIPGLTYGRGIGIIDWRGMPHLLDSLTLLQRQQTAEFQNAMDEWLSIFLGWLIESENGQDEAAMFNNHGTFYDVIVTSLALYLDMGDVAQGMIAQTKKRILSQISLDGSQSHELARTKPFHYSAFNLLAFSQMATLAEKAELNLWDYPSQQDQRIYQAYQFILHNQHNKKLWPGKQEHELPLDNLVGVTLKFNQQIKTDQYLQALVSFDQASLQQGQQCALLFNFSYSFQAQRSEKPKLCLY
jgi:hypothetical protein